MNTTYATTVTSNTDEIVGIGGVADAADDVLSDARAVRVDPSLHHGSLQKLVHLLLRSTIGIESVKWEVGVR
jgi:hypothetical protein